MTVGIYEIINATTGERYIGSSIDVEKRFLSHKSSMNGGYSGCTHLQRAWKKYGESNFVFSILKECKECDLLMWEQFFLDNCEHEYNVEEKAFNGDYQKKRRLKKERLNKNVKVARTLLEQKQSEVFEGLFTQ